MSSPIRSRVANISAGNSDTVERATSTMREGVPDSMKVNHKGNQAGKLVLILLLNFAAARVLSAQAFPNPAVPPASATLPASQTVAPGFDDLGFIEYASVDQMCDPAPASAPLNTTPGAVVAAAPLQSPPTPAGCKTAGGWLQINGDVIRIPANTIVFFPNTYQTWEEVFEHNPGAVMCSAPGSCTLAAPVRGESGLALTDTVRPSFTFQAHVQGQIVNGSYIAGIVYVAQQFAAGMQGFIEQLNYADGSMTVNGTRIQINDPVLQLQDMNGNLFNKGRYSIGQSPDVRFAADQSNTTIRSKTGYPMCIPRVAPSTYPAGPGTTGMYDPYLQGQDDPQCPEINRPRNSTGTLIDVYTMNAPGAGPGFDNPFPQDPYTEVPFEVGDFVTVIGTRFQDASGKAYVSATSITDNLGVYTAPNTDPAYVDIEVLLQGTAGTPAPAFPQEAARRAVVEGFSTDPLRNVDISAVDINSCGDLSFRLPTWVSNFPVEQGLPLIGERGRWRFRPNGGTFLPPVQNVGVQVSGARIDVQNNGLVYGSYQLPNPIFEFPENLIPGNPPPSYNFGDFPFLVSGTGPWPTPSSVFDSQLIQVGLKRNEVPQPQSTQMIGQLAPWPDKGIAPPAQTCNPADPNSAHAVATFTASTTPITAGTVITLSTQGSFPLAGPFAWAQVVNTGDPIVTINNSGSATASFIAPAVATPLNLTFQLTVGQGSASTPSTATLLVPIGIAARNTPPGVTATGSPNPAPGDGVSIVTLTASGVDPNGGTLTYTWTAPSGITLTPASADGSVQTFVAPNVAALAQPMALNFSVIATSSIAGVPPSTPASAVVTVNPVVDRITIDHVRYINSLSRLIVSAADFSPGVTLTVTLAGPNGESPVINPATGSPYTGVLGPVIPFAQGLFSITFTNLPPPTLVTIRSSAGGMITSGVTVTP